MCKQHLLTAFLFLFFLSGYAQTYHPGTHVVVNDAVAPTPPVPLDARTMFYDSVNFLYRAYNGTAEVLTYLNTANYRSGNFILVVDSGGTLQSNGTYIGGYNTFYMFKDSTTAGGLVKMNLFGMGVGVCTSCLQAANNLSDLASLSQALINLGLNNVNNTSDATKNAATVTLTNHTISGAANTLTNIPNSALSNSAIGLTITSNSASDISVTTTPASLGNNIVANFPSAGTASRGPLTAANWNFFDGKLDSVRVSNDTVYNCVNGTCSFQSVISGTGGVTSVNGTNASLLFSPTTGPVLGQVNPAFGFNWTGQHTYVSFAPIYSTLTTAGGLFYGNGSGQLLQTGAGTTAQILQSTGGTAPVFFTPNSSTVSGWLGYTPLSASLPSTQIYVGNALNTAAAVNMTGDVAINNTGATAIQPNVVTNADLAQMPSNTLKGNNTGGTANAADLTVAQINTMLGAVTGPGTAGKVPYWQTASKLGSTSIVNDTTLGTIDIPIETNIGTLNTDAYSGTKLNVNGMSQLSTAYISGGVSTLWSSYSGINSIFRTFTLGSGQFGDLIEELSNVHVTAGFLGYIGMYSTPYMFAATPQNPGANAYVGGFSSIPVYDNAGATALPLMYGYYSALNVQSGSVTNAYDHFSKELNTVNRVPNLNPTVTNHYAFYAEAFTKAAHNYGVYINGIDTNYFGGMVGIGITGPSARLNIAAGTATAGSSPLKFTSGTVLTTPEIGAVEFNNGLFMGDSSNSKRDTFATRSWVRNNTPAAGLANVLTTTGDIIYSSSGTTAARLGIGSTGQILTVAGGVPSWAANTATSGTYTPTPTNTTNITTSTVSSACTYIRNGNIIHVVVAGLVTPTATLSNSVLTFTLPFTTSVTSQASIGNGVVQPNAGGALYVGGLVAITSGTTGTFSFFYVGPSSSSPFSFSFDYTL